ncbi:MAG: hydroxymethylbilane synthase, partial [Planctomycetia bacterium]|nr:hydroxymethylbilane synthase [Planctomycetia bacterium]
MHTLKLGTRRSLLAWAQSGWVAREIERLNPGLKVELVGIDTRGDRIQDVPLQAVAGKEFFVAELDEALRTGSVDLTVHSLKDLSLDRPSDFTLAAIPRRENPRDVVLFGPHAIERLKQGETLKIGTSSPRRLENLPSFLSQALPGREPARLQFVEIRGNVNTRLSRVHEPLTSDRYLDGVVLAFAGLIRLWADERARTDMAPLLKGVRWMVLPLRECPAAPGQGALAVECRSNDAFVRDALGKLHHGPSARQVELEREVLRESGGGCHQRFGATALDAEGLSPILFIRGKMPDGRALDERRFEQPSHPRAQRTWDGTEWRAASTHQKLPTQGLPTSGRAVFVAHARAAEGAELSQARVWTSGVPSWFKLAREGVWVEGCAENLGYISVASTIAEPVLDLPTSWMILTHDRAHTGWPKEFDVVPTYSVSAVDYSAQAIEALQQATSVFW